VALIPKVMCTMLTDHYVPALTEYKCTSERSLLNKKLASASSLICRHTFPTDGDLSTRLTNLSTKKKSQCLSRLTVRVRPSNDEEKIEIKF
jgi:hypothetical protein